jgi:hypothetical protein
MSFSITQSGVRVQGEAIGTIRHFRFWHKADIPVTLSDVRFWG